MSLFTAVIIIIIIIDMGRYKKISTHIDIFDITSSNSLGPLGYQIMNELLILIKNNPNRIHTVFSAQLECKCFLKMNCERTYGKTVCKYTSTLHNQQER